MGSWSTTCVCACCMDTASITGARYLANVLATCHWPTKLLAFFPSFFTSCLTSIYTLSVMTDPRDKLIAWGISAFRIMLSYTE